MDQNNIQELIENFDFLHNKSEESMKDFPNSSAYFYSRVIQCLNSEGLEKCLSNKFFTEYLYAVLSTWGMDRLGGGPRLKIFKEFEESIFRNKDNLLLLKDLKIEELNSESVKETLKVLKELFENFDIMESKNGQKLVAVSKLLHNLLPNLVMPIDRRYTLNFFYGNSSYDQKNQLQKFSEIFLETHKILINSRVGKKLSFDWDTSLPKLLDNVIIAFQKSKKIVKK